MGMLKTCTEKQAEWISKLEYENIPREVLTRTRWILLDSIGCIINGLKGGKLSGSEDEKILKVSSAMVYTELYEGCRFAVGHPASHIVPILLQEGIKRELSYKEVLTMLAGAYEISGRWGSAVRFSNEILGHGTVMISGAAVVEGCINGLSAEELAEYLILCESLPEVSSWQTVFCGSRLHDYYTGISALNAKYALYMFKDKVKSSERIVSDVYENIKGTNINPEALCCGLGDDWYLSKSYFKIHTGCRFIHMFADVICSWMEKGLTKDEIEDIHIYTYKKAAKINEQEVFDELQAKFSTPAALAALILKGRLYPEDIEHEIEDPQLNELASRIYLEEDSKYDQMLPDIRAGRVELRKKTGEFIVEEVFHAEGDFDSPKEFTQEQLADKFRRVTGKRLQPDEQNALVKNILEGDENTGIDEILGTYSEAVSG